MPGINNTEEKNNTAESQPIYPSYKQQFDYFYEKGAAADFTDSMLKSLSDDEGSLEDDSELELSVELIHVERSLCWTFQGKYLTAMFDLACERQDQYPGFMACIVPMLAVYNERQRMTRKKQFSLCSSNAKQLIDLNEFSQEVNESLKQKCPANYEKFKSFERAFDEKFLEPMMVLHKHAEPESDAKYLTHLLKYVNIDILNDREKMGFNYFSALSENLEAVIDASEGVVAADIEDYMKTVDPEKLFAFIKAEKVLAKEHAEDQFFSYSGSRAAIFNPRLRVAAVIFSILMVLPLIVLIVQRIHSKRRDDKFDREWGDFKDTLRYLSASSQKKVIKHGKALFYRAHERAVVRRDLTEICSWAEQNPGKEYGAVAVSDAPAAGIVKKKEFDPLVVHEDAPAEDKVAVSEEKVKTRPRTWSPLGITDVAKISKTSTLFRKRSLSADQQYPLLGCGPSLLPDPLIFRSGITSA